jgi:hypothetical protein
MSTITAEPTTSSARAAAAPAPAPVAKPQPVFRPGHGHWITKAIDQTLFTAPKYQFDHPKWETHDEGEAILKRDGYLVIPHMFTDQEADKLLHRLVHDGEPDAAYEHKNWCFNKTLGLEYQEKPDWLWALDKDRGIEQLDRLLGSDCRIMHGGLWSTGPGRKMGLHVDHRAMILPDDMELPAPFEMPCYLAVLIGALEDQTPEMGPTMFIPGSHRRAVGPMQAPITPLAVVLKKGDGLLLRGDVCHGAAMNTGPARRNHFHSTWGNVYVEPFLPPVTLSKYWDPSVLAGATPRQRRILGGWGHANGGREGIWARENGIDPNKIGVPAYGT